MDRPVFSAKHMGNAVEIFQLSLHLFSQVVILAVEINMGDLMIGQGKCIRATTVEIFKAELFFNI